MLKSIATTVVTILILTNCAAPSDTDELVYVQISSTTAGDTLADTIRVRVFPTEKKVVLNSIALVDTVGGLVLDKEIKSLPDVGGVLFEGGTWSSACDVYSPQAWTCNFSGTSLRMPEYSEDWFVSGDTLINQYSSTANIIGYVQIFGDTTKYVRTKKQADLKRLIKTAIGGQ